MRKFLIDERVFGLFPQARVCRLFNEYLDHGIPWDGTEMLAPACREAARRLGETPFAERAFFAPWRVAFRVFGAAEAWQDGRI
ncbi:MAG: hypothetical protein Q7I97_07270 [Thermovirgaceae bacterium]|nr:hypothetical protein [Thermovirgaceae bacterium]